MSEVVNHKEAFELACYHRESSNLASSYLEIHELLNTVWHCMNDDSPPDFPMREIESVLGPNFGGNSAAEGRPVSGANEG